MISSADLRDKSAQLAFIIVRFQSRICPRIARLKLQQFIGSFLACKSEGSYLFAALPPGFKGFLALKEKVLVLTTDGGLEGIF
jgi:hypothetical protein